MLHLSRLLRRRRGRGHVVKYLEGIPTPRTLVDHLAGANLQASSQVVFFSTAPRHVDMQQEQRLSRLFFHHVLYPAGGSRMPYQAVVVRGGRQVRPAAETVIEMDEAKGGSERIRATQPQKGSSGRAPASRAVPAPMVPSLNAGTVNPWMKGAPPSSWARADPARRPFFVASKPEGQLGRGVAWASSPPYAFSSSPSTTTTAGHEAPARRREVCDAVFAPLRGVVEQALWQQCQRSSCKSSASEEGNRGDGDGRPFITHTASSLLSALRDVLVTPSGGYLPLTSSETSKAVSNSSSCSDSLGKEAALQRLVQHHMETAHRRHQGESSSQGGGYFYLQTALPNAVVISLPWKEELDHGTGDSAVKNQSKRHLCTLAGGVEPLVPFAVGRTIPSSTAAAAASLPPTTPTSLARRLFPHISCLNRVGIVAAKGETAAAALATDHHRLAPAPAPATSAVLCEEEPWRLGGAGVDVAVKQTIRTAAERNSFCVPTSTSSCSSSSASSLERGGASCCLGRPDVETYLLPQRELLLVLHVPPQTEAICVAQNVARLRRQVKLGHESPQRLHQYLKQQQLMGVEDPANSSDEIGTDPSDSWLSMDMRRTSRRVMIGQYINNSEATKGNGSSKSGCRLAPRTTHEVRALPGDVVYIPKGWGFTVQRIIGTAVGHVGGGQTRVQAVQQNAPTTAATTVRGKRLLPAPPTVAAHNASTTGSSSDTDTAAAAARLESLEVDAFCLHYLPYPQLSEAQANVYIAANYVHRGIDEFYEKGGNSVYHNYQ